MFRRVPILATGVTLAAVGYGTRAYAEGENDVRIGSVRDSITDKIKETYGGVKAFFGGAVEEAAEQMESMTRSRLKYFVNDVPSKLYLVGSNRFKLISAGSEEFFASPRGIGFFQKLGVKDVSMAETHAAAIDSNGDLYQWGTGFSDSATGTEADIVPEKTLTGQKLTSVVSNKEFLFCLNENGDVFQVPARKGDVGYLQADKKSFDLARDSALNIPLGFREKVVKVDVGECHLLGNGVGVQRPFVLEESDVNALLSGKTTEIVAGPKTDSILIKKELVRTHLYKVNLKPLDSNQLFRGEKMKGIAAGSFHTLLLSENGRVYSFGSNELLQLGLGDYDRTRAIVSAPTEITNFENIPVRVDDIAAGADTSFLICNQSKQCEVYSFGAGNFGQLGNGSWMHALGSPTRVKQFSNCFYWDEKKGYLPIKLKYISAGFNHYVGVMDTAREEKQTVNTKYGFYRQFGDNVYSWGYNHDYQLGSGKRHNQNEPQNPLPIIFAKGASPEKDEEALELENEESFKAGVRLQLQKDQKIRCGHDVTAIYSM